MTHCAADRPCPGTCPCGEAVEAETAATEQVPRPPVIHMCPPGDAAIFPCCGGWPLEHLGQRMTLDPASVTCERENA